MTNEQSRNDQTLGARNLFRFGREIGEGIENQGGENNRQCATNWTLPKNHLSPEPIRARLI